MVTHQHSGKRGRAQERKGDHQARQERRTTITPETPYGECSERLTAFGGLLALVKFLDLIGFEKAFAEHYVHPAHFTHREHSDRSIMNSQIGHRERSEATLGVR